MLGLSTADGFMSVKEGVDDMIKHLANEPSVGLFFVQKHAQASMPYLLDVKCDCRLIQTPTWGRQTYISNSNAAVAVGCSNKSGHQEDEGSRSYLSAVLSSAKQRAAVLRPPLNNQPSKVDQPVPPSSQSPFESVASAESSAEAEELPVSSSLEIDEKPLNTSGSHGSLDCEVLHPMEDYSKFKYEKEAEFEAWLQKSEGHGKFLEPGD